MPFYLKLLLHTKKTIFKSRSDYGLSFDFTLVNRCPGMTPRVQEDVLQYFNGGLHKILIATSVIEEGLDVQKCNYVIRYLHVTNDIARIQSRGRVDSH